MAANDTYTIAIIGGGFSGTMTAVNLLRAKTSQPLRIVLVEPSALARGVAYGTRDAKHMLNVPAGGMSAFADDDDHFVQYLHQHHYKAAGSDFVSRQIYGDYLQNILRATLAALDEKNAESLARREFSYLNDRAIDIVPHSDKLDIALASGAQIKADRVVLAIGHAAPKLPFLQSADFNTQNQRYIDNPWGENLVERIDRRKPLLLIGTGLTAVDIVMTLIAQRFRQPIYAISRHGLHPLAHRGLSDKSAAVDLALPNELPNKKTNENSRSFAAIMHWLRERIDAITLAGGDWRDVIAALRAQLPALWQSLSVTQRARFLRHGAAYWDIHRHRLAPPVAASLSDILAAKRLHIAGGRIRALADNGNGVKVVWRPRGESTDVVLHVGSVINCTGASGDVRANDDVLSKSLLQRGLITPDTLKLGIEIADDYRVMDAHGQSAAIFYIGPWLKAKYWEATAVPELRAHAKKIADAVLASLASDTGEHKSNENLAAENPSFISDRSI